MYLDNPIPIHQVHSHMGGLVLEGTEAKILSDVVAQFYAYLSGCMFNDPVGMAIYGYEVYNWLAQNAYR